MKSTALLRHRMIGFLVFFALAGLMRDVLAAAPLLLGVQSMSAGGKDTCVIIKGGAQCWGDNYYGELGIGSASGSPTAVPVIGLGSGVTSISGGYVHTCAIVNGAAMCWGDNLYGELGNAVGNTSSTPVAVTGLASPVSTISAGQYLTCAIVNGSAMCWGDNLYGGLGNGTTTNSTTPVAVTGLGSGVTGIAAGGYHACAIVNGGVQCWGYNSFGELGNGTNNNSSTPVAVTGLGAGSGVTTIVTGGYHSCALVGGGVQCWGEEHANGLGGNSSVATTVSGLSSGVIALVAGGAFNCAIVNNDATHPVKCWGTNSFGQLGNGSNNSSDTPVDATFLPALGGASVSAITAGDQHVCATILAGGVTKMDCWGDNTDGELGVSSAPVSAFAASPVFGLSTGVTAIGSGTNALHVCAVVNGAAKCWGSNASGQLGNGASAPSSVPQAVIGLNAGVTAVAMGDAHSCAIVNGGEQCWGENYAGELGNGSTDSSSSPVPVTSLTSGVTAIAAGGGFSCAVVDGGAQCWGYNMFGQLGNDSTTESLTPQTVTGLGAGSGVTAIATGAVNTCAIVNGGVQCWGDNNTGQLGDGTTNSSAVPIAVSGLTTGVTALAVSSFDACAVVGSGASSSVKCWGDNSNGEFATGQFGSYPTLPVAGFGQSSNIVGVATGSYFNCAIISGAAQCAGYDANGQLGRIISGFYDSSPGLVTGLAAGVTSIAASDTSACAITGSGGAVCWGDDRYGQLGDNRFLSEETPQAVLAGNEIFANGFEN
jgi:alpha-tubulin suppressor-like RCC1 family protein